MTSLTIEHEDNTGSPQTISNYQDIVTNLNRVNVQLERWHANVPLSKDATEAMILAAYQDDIDKINNRYNFESVDVISMYPDHPQRKELREKFLSEHTHSDFEIRFFVEGKALFYLHIAEQVYMVLCEAGDLISVPAYTPHWFDMGEKPDFKSIRFFTTTDGWIADFTDSKIASKFPSFEQYIDTISAYSC